MLVIWPAFKSIIHSHNLGSTLEFSAKSEAVFSKPFHKTSINTGEREYGPDHRRLLLPIFCDAKFIHCKPRGGSALGPFTSAHCPPRPPPPPAVPSRPSLRQAAPSRDEMTASTTLVTRAAEVNFAACTILFFLCPSGLCADGIFVMYFCLRLLSLYFF